MKRNLLVLSMFALVGAGASALMGCRGSMPHAFTWPAGGDTQFTHPKPPEGGYYSNWDPYAVELSLEPLEDVNPVRTQHVLVATVRDKDGKPLPNRRVEWIISEGSVGDIVEVDESGWRASRGYKVDNHYAVTHTNNGPHVLDRGNDDPSDDVQLEEGQTWCVITSPIEGDTHITAYAPGIYDWSKHKVFAVKHWYDVKWECPPPATNPTGTSHEFVTRVSKYSDNSPLPGYLVTYKLLDGPAGSLEPGGNVASVTTDAAGMARVTLRQSTPAEGTNNIEIEIMRPENVQCCKPPVKIATCSTSKTWIGPKIGITKQCTPQALVGETINYTIEVSNPSQVDATNVTVTDNLPDGIEYVSSTPAASAGGSSLTWSLGTLSAQGRSSISVQARATRTGTFENCAEVRADQNLQDRACCTTVVTSPQLQLEKRCPAEVMLCDPIEYVIVVRNSGDGPANNVRVSDELPSGLTTEAGRTSVVSNVGTLAPGEAKQVAFRAKASQVGTYNNTATAAGDGGLSAQASCTTVVRQPTLAVTKTGPQLRYVNRNAEYQITVTNTGDSEARNTVLTDPIPAGTQFVSATEGGSFSGGTVTWNLGTLAPGASRNVGLTLRATTLGSAKNVATATATCANAMAETMMEIKGIPAILLECEDLEDPVEVGGQTTYVIVVTNQGSETGTNIRIKCDLPAEEQFVSADGPVSHEVAGQTVTFAPLPTLAPKAKASYRVMVKGVGAGDVRFRIELTADQQSSAPIMETESTRFYE